jgi:hypothetical protein
MGLPGETKETIEETINFATEINPHTIQVSLAAPYPGTFLFNQAMKNGWLDDAHAELVNEDGVQIAPLHYPHLSHSEIFDAVEEFYRRFYFRSGKIASIVGEMIRSPQMMKRRLREGVEFFPSCASAAPRIDRAREHPLSPRRPGPSNWIPAFAGMSRKRDPPSGPSSFQIPMLPEPGDRFGDGFAVWPRPIAKYAFRLG